MLIIGAVLSALMFAIPVTAGLFAEDSCADDSGDCGVGLTWNYYEATGLLTITGTGDMINYENYSPNLAPWHSYLIKNVEIGNGVTSIGSYAFLNCKSLTSITIPGGVTGIRDYAFNGCSALTSVTILNGVEEIWEGAFQNCNALTSVTIPSTVNSIGAYAFGNCGALTSVTIPNGVGEIKNYTFANCFALTSITIPSTVNSIGAYAFDNCGALTSVTIPSTVNSIGAYAFHECYALKHIIIDDASSLTIGSNAFNTKYSESEGFCVYVEVTNGSIGVITDTVMGTTKYCTAEEDVRYHEGEGNLTETIGWKLEDDSLVLTGTGPMPVGYLPWSSYSKSITSVSISNGVTSIGGNAFQNCYALTSVTIPSTVTSIGAHAFESCNALTSVTIPSTVNSIGAYAFDNCSALTSVTIPSTVTSIETYAFHDCYALTSVTILNDVEEIWGGAFQNCFALTSVTIPSTVGSMGEYTFDCCFALTSVTIPNGVEEIKDHTFASCYALTSVTIPSTVTTIEGGAFYGCSHLKYITMPNTAGDIGSNAFLYCSALTSVTITGAISSETSTDVLDVLTSWALPGQVIPTVEKVSIDTADGGTTSIAPMSGRKLCIAPDITVTNNGVLLTGGNVYTGDGSSFIQGIECCRVTFDSHDGYPTPAVQIVEKNSKVLNPGTVAKYGYNFNGWYGDNGAWIFDEPVIASMSLTAHWGAVICTVTFDANGGNPSTTTDTVSYGETYGGLPTPTRTGFLFSGWFTELSGGSEVRSDTTVTSISNHNLYAHWTAQPHGDGSQVNDATEKMNEANTNFILSIFGVVVSLLAVVVIILRR